MCLVVFACFESCQTLCVPDRSCLFLCRLTYFRACSYTETERSRTQVFLSCNTEYIISYVGIEKIVANSCVFSAPVISFVFCCRTFSAALLRYCTVLYAKPERSPTPKRSPTLQCPGIHFDTGEVVFTDGATYTEASQELCFLDTDDAATTTTGGTSGGREERVEDFECVVYSATAPTTFGHPTLTLDTAEVETWNLGTSVTAGFSCPTQLVSQCGPELRRVWSVTVTCVRFPECYGNINLSKKIWTLLFFFHFCP